jgi:hypothetical protein
LHIQGHRDRSNFHKFCRELKQKAKKAAKLGFNDSLLAWLGAEKTKPQGHGAGS